MKLNLNAVDIFDMVVDEVLCKEQLELVSHLLYADKRGGALVSLWESEEFIASLSKQLYGN